MNLLKAIFRYIKVRFSRVAALWRNQATLRKIKKQRKDVNYEQKFKLIAGLRIEEATPLIEKLATEMAIEEIKPYIKLYKNKSKLKPKPFEVNDLKEEITRLNSRLINLELAQQNSKVINYSETTFLDEQLKRITLFLQRPEKRVRKLSTISISEFSDSILKLEEILSKSSLINKFNKREEEKRKEEESEKKQYKIKIAIINTLIGQNKLDEAKNIISILEGTISKTKYQKEISQFQKTKDKFRKKELENYEKEQNEIFKKHDQEAARLRLAEEARIEQELILEVQGLLLQKQQEEIKKEKEKSLIILLVKKSNWNEFKFILEANNISTLYHFTEKANLKSIIEKGGLFSWQYCDKNGIKIPSPGGDTLSRKLDIKYNLQDYVRASFCSSHPMMYAAMNKGWINDPVILKINIDVCYFKNSWFANMNATDNKHEKGNSPDFLRELYYHLFSQRYNDLGVMEKKYYQAEILVKTWIPIEFITNINDYK